MIDESGAWRATVPLVDWTERVAIGASAACLFHCLALPFLFTFMPLLTVWTAVPLSFHRWILAVAIPCALLALFSGRMRHGIAWPLVLGAGGLALLALGTFVLGESPAETVATVLGSGLLASAHIANWRMRRSCC